VRRRAVVRLTPTRLALALLAAGLAAASLAACAANASPSPSVGIGQPSIAPSSSASSSHASSSPAPHLSPSVAPGSRGPSIAIDPALLRLLPATLGGLDRQTDPAVDAQAFADPTLAVIASAGASALYVDPASGAFAYATILRLRAPTIDESAFRAYRDSFDSGACSQAGGVGGNAQAVLGGRTTYIATCNGGVRTYHAVLPTAHAILSISSVGANRLGEQLAAAATS
jgi:hypothetical protein